LIALAGLALIGLLSFFLLRRRRKNKLSSPAAQPFVAEQSQSSGYGGWPGQDQRSSVSNTLMSTPSQVPQSMYSPPYLGQQFAQAPAQPAGQYYSEVHEMPIESPHREAHEMGP
jgi:LPXTG-motif cell wall-anchored protein